MQLQSRRFFPERLLYYWGERFNANYAHTEKEDVKYRSLKPVFVISILDYVMFPDDQDLRRTFHIYDAEHQHILRSKDGTSLMQMVFIELPKIKGNVPPKLVDWVDCFVFGLVQETAKTYIKDVIKLVDEVAIRKGEMKQMIDVIEKAREDEKAIRGYAEEVALEVGIEKGIKKGIEKGIEKTALNLKKFGAPLEQIQQVTGLSIERISEL